MAGSLRLMTYTVHLVIAADSNIQTLQCVTVDHQSVFTTCMDLAVRRRHQTYSCAVIGDNFCLKPPYFKVPLRPGNQSPQMTTSVMCVYHDGAE